MNTICYWRQQWENLQIDNIKQAVYAIQSQTACFVRVLKLFKLAGIKAVV